MKLNDALELPIFTYEAARSLNYAFQYNFLNSVSRRIPWLQAPLLESQPHVTRLIQNRLFRLLKEDAKNISSGVYPLQVLAPESPIQHIRRLSRIFIDGLKIYHRRKTRNAKSFSVKAQEYLDELPDYYKRNFHFQTDGYLSENSAELYDHQVELLFGGAADAMRRLLIKPFKEYFKTEDGKGLTFLELASGTGRTTRFMSMAFPRAKIVATDLSHPYLKVARRRLQSFDRVSIVQADAARLPFQDREFDAVYSVFLFHELPYETRQEVFTESKRVLKKDGLLGIVDSLQLHDVSELDEVLSTFPKNFHEPFYKNYIEKPLEDLGKQVRLKEVGASDGFFSKALWFKK